MILLLKSLLIKLWNGSFRCEEENDAKSKIKANNDDEEDKMNYNRVKFSKFNATTDISNPKFKLGMLSRNAT